MLTLSSYLVGGDGETVYLAETGEKAFLSDAGENVLTSESDLRWGRRKDGKI